MWADISLPLRPSTTDRAIEKRKPNTIPHISQLGLAGDSTLVSLLLLVSVPRELLKSTSKHIDTNWIHNCLQRELKLNSCWHLQLTELCIWAFEPAWIRQKKGLYFYCLWAPLWPNSDLSFLKLADWNPIWIIMRRHKPGNPIFQTHTLIHTQFAFHHPRHQHHPYPQC